ncbi:MAG TPA: ribosome maturation factor [Edaphocola sp.]|nr:ribosome maturation factor [Edaphocola sp.]
MEQVIEKIKAFTEEILTDSSLFVVDLFIKPTNNIKVFLDGDNGISIDVMSKINRALYKKLEETALFPDGDFSLEVSSPGIDKPLKLRRQYPKNIGRTVSVVLLDGTECHGVLNAVNDSGITVSPAHEKKQKGADAREIVILFDRIKTTIVELTF